MAPGCEPEETLESWGAKPEEELWSGSSAKPAPGGWYSGKGFFLNEVEGEELFPWDKRLTDEDRAAFGADDDDEDKYFVFELPVTDERSAIPQVNRGALRLADLNHNSADLRSVLLTTYDFVDNVPWLQEELRLRSDVPLTLCTHCWCAREEDEGIAALRKSFDDVVVHFPKTFGGGAGRTFRARCWLLACCLLWMRSLSAWGRVFATTLLNALGAQLEERRSRGWEDWECTNHAKLLLLEFGDRLRVAVTTANLCRKHWCFRGEAVWVQDFPRASHEPAVSRLLDGGFAACLGNFVADLLAKARGGRQQAWLRTLASFDFSQAQAILISSLPGLFPRARTPPKGGLVLRLWAECRSACAPKGRLRRLRRRWLLQGDSLQEDSSRELGSLSVESSQALEAASRLGWFVRPEVEIFGGELCAEDCKTTVLVRAVVEARPDGPAWLPEMPALLSCMEVDHGLQAMRRALARQRWPREEESCFAAITASIDYPKEAWLAELDAHVCRDAPFYCQEKPGPVVVVPGNNVPLHAAYFELAKRGQLAEHSSPWHAPGRELVYNHSKLLLRQFWDRSRARAYGWVYVGSHNLQSWAWGIPTAEEMLWVGNRELGVLLLQPKGSEDELFARTPMPFGLPLQQADMEGRRLVQFPPREEEFPMPEGLSWGARVRWRLWLAAFACCGRLAKEAKEGSFCGTQREEWLPLEVVEHWWSAWC